MKPTIGRTVHYQATPNQVQAMVITHIHSDTCVNGNVHVDGGGLVGHSSVNFESQDALGHATPNTWHWPVIA